MGKEKAANMVRTCLFRIATLSCQSVGTCIWKSHWHRWQARSVSFLSVLGDALSLLVRRWLRIGKTLHL